MLRRALVIALGSCLASIFGLASSASATISISVYKQYNPTLTNESVYFSAYATTDCGTIQNYTWDFGDGNRITVPDDNITHSWDSAGDYTVQVTVTDSCGGSDSTSFTEHVLTDVAPMGAFSTNVADLTVYADPSATTDNDPVNNGAQTPVDHYVWRWGDGSRSQTTSASSSGGVATHQYAHKGTYTISMTAYDTAYNASQTITHTVTVPPATPKHWVFKEDTSHAVSYHGRGWNVVPCKPAACSPNHKEHSTKARGDWARFVFKGVRAQIIGTRGRHSGVVRIYIDGVLMKRINLYASRRHDGMVLYTTPPLKDAIHGVQVRVLSRGKPVSLDAFKALVIG